MKKLIILLLIPIFVFKFDAYSEEIECPPGFEEWLYKYGGGPDFVMGDEHPIPSAYTNYWIRYLNNKVEVVIDINSWYYQHTLKSYLRIYGDEKTFVSWLQYYIISQNICNDLPCEYVFYKISQCKKRKSCYVSLDETTQVICLDSYSGSLSPQIIEYNNKYYLQTGVRNYLCGTACCAQTYLIDNINNTLTVVSQSETMLDGCFDDNPIFDCLKNIQQLNCITNCK